MRLLTILLVVLSSVLQASPLQAGPGQIMLPVYFEANRGQADNRVQFLSRGSRCRLLLMNNGSAALHYPEGSLEMRLGGAARKSRAAGVAPVMGRTNYFAGNDRRRWQTNVPAYSQVEFRNVYRGIDLFYYARDGRLEYDFVIAPGADPAAISLNFSGADKTWIDRQGNLVFSLSGGTITQQKPAIYQMSGEGRREIAGRYAISDRSVRFEIADFDRTLPLIIDPVLSYATFLGGANNDGAFSMALDRDGNIYVAGITASTDFPKNIGSVPGRALAGATDAFIAKLNPAGTALLYATYLGGTDEDTAMAIAVDSAGNAYVTGGTISSDFPTTPGAVQTRYGGTGGHSAPPFSHPSGDAFVAKLSPTGSLIYSSYLGGTGIDHGYGVAVDSSGAVYLAGLTESPNFPITSGAYQSTLRGFPSIFVAKINSSGSSLIYSTFVGGSAENYGLALALDSSGNAFVTGVTTSDDFPTTPGAFQTRYTGRVSSYVIKLNSTGTALLYSTYFGGSVQTYAYGIAVDGDGSAYVTGATTSPDFPVTSGAYSARPKRGAQGGDVFVTKFEPSGASLRYSSVFGGGGPDFGTAIAVDKSGTAYVAGRTQANPGRPGNDFPITTAAVQRCGMGGPSAFVVRLNAAGSILDYGSYLGDGAGASAIALDSAGKTFVSGWVYGDFPVTSGALQSKYAGGTRGFDSTNLYPSAGDAFVAAIDLSAPSPMNVSCVANAASFAPDLISPGEIISFLGTGIGPAGGVAAVPGADNRFPTILGDTRVLFDGVPAPLLYVRSDQVNAVSPFGLAGKSTTQVQIEFKGIKSNALSIPVASGHLGIFTADASSTGQAAALNQDYSVNSPANPARPGDAVMLFGTGLAGLINPPLDDGSVPQTALPVLLTLPAFVGCRPAEVLYVGTAPGLVAGAIQINILIPDVTQCGPGPYDVAFSGGNNIVSISVR